MNDEEKHLLKNIKGGTIHAATCSYYECSCPVDMPYEADKLLTLVEEQELSNLLKTKNTIDAYVKLDKAIEFIENAPHEENCNTKPYYEAQHNVAIFRTCICWKANALKELKCSE